MNKKTTWIFDPAPASGSRQGGDPAFHAFDHNIETFTREVLQNSNDQRIKDASDPVEVKFELIELAGKDLTSFKRHIEWDKLRDHFNSVIKTNEQNKQLKDQLDRIERGEKLLLLKISDYQTQGLQGAESGVDSNFTALCKDKLYSHKETESAGGTYGLGKSVLWGFSGISTVFFNSYLAEAPEGHNSPRLIGRVGLSSHKMSGEWYSGSGWFGVPAKVDKRKRAESVWNKTAKSTAKELYLERDSRPGTTILIPGFMDPTASERTKSEYVEEIGEAAGKFFWPSMLSGATELEVEAKSENTKEVVNPKNDPTVAPFLDCYESFLTESYQEELEEPGDVVCREIDVDIPAKADGKSTANTSVTLCVRLAREDSASELVNHVGYFRGSGMVVKYKQPRTSISARPFHAVVIAGNARNLDNPGKPDRDLEEFLRAAEPPAHQDWKSTKKLKSKYKRGYRKALQEMKDDIKEQLSEIIRPGIKHGEEGPDKLRKRFDIFKKGSSSGGKGGPERPEEKIRVRNFDSRFIRSEARWELNGVIGIEGGGHQGWEVELEAVTLGEDGSRQGEVHFDAAEFDKNGANYELNDQKAVISARDGVREIELSLITEPVVDLGTESLEEVGELYIELEGKVFKEG